MGFSMPLFSTKLLGENCTLYISKYSNPIHIIYNKGNAGLNLNNIFKFLDNSSLFIKNRACIDRQAKKVINYIYKR